MSTKHGARLYISTSSYKASVGLETQGSFDFIESNESNRHSDFINLAIAQILQRHSYHYKNLTQIILDRGPGSFTGVRVGVACAKALSYSLNIPVYSLNSLKALLYPSDNNCEYALNAFRNSIYYLNPQQEVEKKTISEFDCYLKNLPKPKILIGDVFTTYHSLLSKDAQKKIHKSVTRYPHVKNLYLQFTHNPNSFQVDSWQSLTPFYLRLSSAEEVYLEKRLFKQS